MIRPDWNPDEVRDYVSGLSDSEVSRRLDIVQAQIPLALNARDEEALQRLREHETIIIQERYNRPCMPGS